MFVVLRPIALRVVFALLVSAVLLDVLVQYVMEQPTQRLHERARDPVGRLVASELARVPPSQRSARLAELSRDVGHPMYLVPRGSARAHEREGGRGEPPSWERAFPIDEDQAVIVSPPRPPGHDGPRGRGPGFPGLGFRPGGHGPRRMGPEEPRHSPPRPYVPLLAFLVLATGLTSVLVALPLARRIRAIERAVNELSRGNFGARVEGPRDDTLGPIAAALDRSAERLTRMFSEREELLQAVSHELGTPLSRMRFHLELLERTATTDTQRERVRAIDEEIRELDDLALELVHWMEADSASLALQTLPLRPALEEIAELEGAASPRELAITVEVPPDLAVQVAPRQFSRAIENLVRNALRYARSTVVISARSLDDGVEVSVRDDGPGIPEGDRVRVLQPFVRLDPSRSREYGGVGLGLAIVRRIVERHGGAVRVGQAPEGGAALVTRWPAASG